MSKTILCAWTQAQCVQIPCLPQIVSMGSKRIRLSTSTLLIGIVGFRFNYGFSCLVCGFESIVVGWHRFVSAHRNLQGNVICGM